jgi:hypothetical protein
MRSTFTTQKHNTEQSQQYKKFVRKYQTSNLAFTKHEILHTLQPTQNTSISPSMRGAYPVWDSSLSDLVWSSTPTAAREPTRRSPLAPLRCACGGPRRTRDLRQRSCGWRDTGSRSEKRNTRTNARQKRCDSRGRSSSPLRAKQRADRA